MFSTPKLDSTHEELNADSGIGDITVKEEPLDEFSDNENFMQLPENLEHERNRGKKRGRKKKVKKELNDSGDPIYSCDLCGKTYTKKARLSDHKLSHEKPEICHLCGKHFARKGQLKEHILTHTEGKSYSCGKCPKMFKSKKRFLEHEKSHDAYREFMCDICATGFVTESRLKEHRRMHETDHAIVCKQLYYYK